MRSDFAIHTRRVRYVDIVGRAPLLSEAKISMSSLFKRVIGLILIPTSRSEEVIKLFPSN